MEGLPMSIGNHRDSSNADGPHAVAAPSKMSSRKRRKLDPSSYKLEDESSPPINSDSFKK